jgi:hypothetical protein
MYSKRHVTQALRRMRTEEARQWTQACSGTARIRLDQVCRISLYVRSLSLFKLIFTWGNDVKLSRQTSTFSANLYLPSPEFVLDKIHNPWISRLEIFSQSVLDKSVFAEISFYNCRCHVTPAVTWRISACRLSEKRLKKIFHKETTEALCIWLKKEKPSQRVSLLVILHLIALFYPGYRPITEQLISAPVHFVENFETSSWSFFFFEKKNNNKPAKLSRPVHSE